MTEPYQLASFVVPMRLEEPLDYLPQPLLALWTRRLRHDYAGGSFLATGGAVDQEVPFLEVVGDARGTLDRGFLLRYAGGEGRVGAARDQGGLGNHLTRGATVGPKAATGGVAEQADGTPGWRFAQADAARLSRADALGLGSDPALTVAWVVSGSQGIDAAPRALLALGTLAAPELALTLAIGADGDSVALAGPAPEFNRGAAWALPPGTLGGRHSYVLTRSAATGYLSTSWRLYVDGVDLGVPTSLGTGSLDLGSTATLLGGCPGADPADCLLEGLMLWDRVLDAAQLSLLRKFLGEQAAGFESQAGVFVVTNLNDSGGGSLRQAILDANASTLPSPTIRFRDGLSGTVTLTTGQLKILRAMRIEGPGSGVIHVSGGGTDRVFYLYAAVAPLAPVTIAGIEATNGAGNGSGGAVANYNMALSGEDFAVTDSFTASGGGAIYSAGSLSLSNSRVSGNVGNQGGGIYFYGARGDLSLSGVVIEDNTDTGTVNVRGGGGLFAFLNADHSATIEQCSVTGNQAVGPGGGATIYLYDSASARVAASTISGNTSHSTVSGGPLNISGAGGLLLAHTSGAASSTVENTTVSGNVAEHGNGGGLAVAAPANAAAIVLSTIANNSAPAGSGGGLAVPPGSSVTLRNTIVGDNSASADNDVHGSLSADYTLIESPGSATLTGAHNVTGSDAQLGPLQDNGGPTQTMLPGAGSPAVNAGDPAFAPPPSADQRGLPRVAGARVDMGAVERQ